METVTHLYDTRSEALAAVRELETIGIPTADISIVNGRADAAHEERTSGAGTGAEVGATVGGIAGLLAGVGIMAIPGIGPIVAAGWLASTVAGLVAGGAAGGVIGALTSAGVDKKYADVYAEGVRRGGSLVTVRVASERAGPVCDVLGRHGPVDPMARDKEYRRAGWAGFDDKAGPYIPPLL